MTAKEQAAIIGSVGVITVEKFFIPVQIHDVKLAWGQTRFLVEPLQGHGTEWVDASRVRQIHKLEEHEQHAHVN